MIQWDFDLQYEDIMRMVGHVSASYGCHTLPMKVDVWKVSLSMANSWKTGGKQQLWRLHQEKHGVCMHL